MMPQVAATSLHHIALTVTDLDASIAWYERVFGIACQMDGPHEAAWASCSPTRSGV